MKITICGSMHHIDGMKAASQRLEELGYETEIPNHVKGKLTTIRFLSRSVRH